MSAHEPAPGARNGGGTDRERVAPPPRCLLAPHLPFTVAKVRRSDIALVPGGLLPPVANHRPLP